MIVIIIIFFSIILPFVFKHNERTPQKKVEEKEYIITGKIIDQYDQKPIQNISIKIESYKNVPDGGPPGVIFYEIGFTQTNENGIFNFNFSKIFFVNKSGFYITAEGLYYFSNDSINSFDESIMEYNITINLTKGSIINGYISDITGNPLNNSYIGLLPKDYSFYIPSKEGIDFLLNNPNKPTGFGFHNFIFTITNESGFFSSSVFPPGEYTVYFYKTNYSLKILNNITFNEKYNYINISLNIKNNSYQLKCHGLLKDGINEIVSFRLRS